MRTTGTKWGRIREGTTGGRAGGGGWGGDAADRPKGVFKAHLRESERAIESDTTEIEREATR